MKVVATRTGLDGQYLRQPGEVFTIKDDVDEGGRVLAFSAKWMVPFEDALKAAGQSPQDSATKHWHREFFSRGALS